MQNEVAIAAIALAIAGCSINTSYVPRTPNKLALGMQRGEAGFYKDGMFAKISSAPAPLVACSVNASAEVGRAASHHGSYQTNITIQAALNVLSVFVPPLIGFGVYFGLRAHEHQQRSYAHIVDAINQHNDEIGCVR